MRVVGWMKRGGKSRGRGGGDGDTPLAELEEQSSKEDRNQFTQVSWAASSFLS